MRFDTHEKFSGRTVGLHWIIAASVLSVLVLGVVMTEMENSSLKFQLYGFHKNLGVLIFPFAVYRIIWRWRNGFPEPVGAHSRLELIASKIVHFVLIIGTVLMPLSGMAMAGFGGSGIPLFGMELVPSNYVDGKPVAYVVSIAGAAHTLHAIAAKLLFVGIALHVAGALKHHVIDKDGTLRRMLGKRL